LGCNGLGRNAANRKQGGEAEPIPPRHSVLPMLRVGMGSHHSHERAAAPLHFRFCHIACATAAGALVSLLLVFLTLFMRSMNTSQPARRDERT
jgi:hypothetical protein